MKDIIALHKCKDFEVVAVLIAFVWLCSFLHPMFGALVYFGVCFLLSNAKVDDSTGLAFAILFWVDGILVMFPLAFLWGILT